MNNHKVVLTRTENDLSKLKENYPNIEWIDFPLIKFEYLDLGVEILEEVNEHYDWLIFTSQNGVRSFFEQIQDLKGKKIACVGPKTADYVQDLGYNVDFVPSHYTSITLAKELPSTSHENLCYIGGNLSSYDTLQVLKEKAHHFMQVEVYHTVSETHDRDKWIEMFTKKPTVISFCSPSAVTSFTMQIDKLNIDYPSFTKYAAIGSTTSGAIEKYINEDAIIGEKHTFDGMVEAINSYLGN